MKTHEISIQTNIFNAIQRPTTQEDNFGEIVDRWDLYYKFHFETNGNETERQTGHLVKYFNGNFAVFHGSLRYDFPGENVTVIKI
jgi:hypothetical protein